MGTLRRVLEWRHAKILAVSLAGSVVALAIVAISANLNRIQESLPQHGFFRLRDLHIVLREVTHMSDVLVLAKAAPTREESRQALAKANNLLYIRFIRLEPATGLMEVPGYPKIASELKAAIGEIDRLLAAGLPLPIAGIEAAQARLGAIENRMAEIYYAYGERSNDAIASAQADLIGLSMMIAAVLGLLAIFAAGTSLLLVNRRATLKKLEYMAWRDQLTGLRNRAWLIKNIEQLMESMRAAGRGFALCLVDLDHFKAVNDAHGHHVGDQLLKTLARLLRQVEDGHEGAVSLRLGGDEFALIVPDSPTAESAIADFGALTNGMVNLEGLQIKSGTSIGVAHFPEQGAEIDALLRHADCALYAAKTNGRGCMVSFTQELLDNANRRLQTEAALRRALGNDEFFLVWQPQFDLVTGRISGAEALLRWRDVVTGQTISPADFIPIAEESGLILDIDRLVLRKACAEAARWHELLPEAPMCSVNISSHQLQNQKLASELAALLKETALPPRSLELEITESSVIENKLVAGKVLRQVQRLGVGIALDDFGTGYSSLSYLPELPVDRLKIDRSFVAGLEHMPRKKNVVGSIMALARSLEMAVVAEGIETLEQMVLLMRAECAYGQGFYFARPVESDVLLLRLGHGTTHYTDWQKHAAESDVAPNSLPQRKIAAA